MTIVVSLRVGDGAVLGADSASSLQSTGGISNVYFNAEKISNLVKGLPLGMATYGLGGMGGRSITYLAKDLRDRLSHGEHAMHLDRDGFTVEEVALKVREFFYEEHYLPEFGAPENGEARPAMGFLIAGYSAKSVRPEMWSVEVDEHGNCPAPKNQCTSEVPSGDLFWRGMPTALNRLVLAWSDEAFGRLVDAGVELDVASEVLRQPAFLAHPAMPVQDAVDLVHYLVDVTCGFVRFADGAPTVAPPIDVASITLHEGFKWIRRKHYYQADLNSTHVTD